MTVKASQDQESKSGLEQLAMEYKKAVLKDCTETESGESEEEEMESPKSVQWRNKKKKKSNNNKVKVHSQVLKIREEDSHIGQDIGEGLSAVKDKVNGFGGSGGGGDYRHHVDVVFLTRPILPCSPLSGKTATTSIKASH